MARVILLSDLCTWNGSGMTRYIGPYVVGSQLEAAGYDVRIIDWFTSLVDPIRFIRDFLTPDTIAVCISTTFLSPAPIQDNSKDRGATLHEYRNSALWFKDAEECVDWFDQLRGIIRKKNPDCRIILGGTRVAQLYSRAPKYIEQTFPQVDYGVMGTSETTIIPLIKDIQSGRTPHGVTRGGITFVSPLVDQKSCPSTRWESKWAIQPGESLPIEISRGCVYNCKFCHYDKKFSTLRDQTSLYEEFIRNHELFGTTQYHFCDDCFNDRLDKVEAVVNTINRLPFQIEWISYARADLSIKFPDTIPQMIQSGARGFFFGIETFNREAGRAAGKGVPPDRVKQFLLNIRKTSLLVEASFITGLPHETVESQLATFDWIADNDPFDLYTTSPLGLYEYHPDLDNTIMDYADYSRNPTKYGFEEIHNRPDGSVYWRHAGMDRDQAEELNSQGVLKWGQNHPRQAMRSFWWYPSYRSLGLSHEAILSLVRGSYEDSLPKMVIDRWQARFHMYQSDLLRRLS